MAGRFYTPSPLGPGELALTGDEARHLAASSRLRPGDPVTLFNGDGRDYPGRVVSVGKRDAVVELADGVTSAAELPFTLEVGTAVPKGDRVDVLVEKLTELGATRWVPLLCDRSVVEPRPAKLDRLRKVVIEASKQCGRAVLMEVGGLTPLADWLAAGPGVIAHTAGGLDGVRFSDRGVRTAVGPEGGFSGEEIAAAVGAGWRPASLGPRVLRVETAAITLAALAAAG